MRCKNRENICTKENNHIRQYLRGLAICQHPWNCKGFTIHKEKYKMWPKPLLHGLSLRKSPIKNCSNLISNQVISESNTTRLYKAWQLFLCSFKFHLVNVSIICECGVLWRKFLKDFGYNFLLRKGESEDHLSINHWGLLTKDHHESHITKNYFKE